MFNRVFKRIAFVLWVVVLFGAFRNYDDSTPDYIQSMKHLALLYAKEANIPVSICLGQAILESSAGNGELVRKANNHFCIKALSGWPTDRIYYKEDDDRDEAGNLKKSPFRVYASAEESFADYVLFLKKDRYKDLFALAPDDYKGWAMGLQAAGYATDTLYGKKLITIIEKYQLHQYDQQQPETNPQAGLEEIESSLAFRDQTYADSEKPHAQEFEPQSGVPVGQFGEFYPGAPALPFPADNLRSQSLKPKFKSVKLR